MTGRRCQGMGRRAAAPAPRRRRHQGPGEGQRACSAVGHVARPRRPRVGPGPVGRKDIDTFVNRLAYLESAGTISRYHRNVICRDARAALAGIRAPGLTRPGRVAAGLPGDFALGRDDIPAEPARGRPGRDLPPEVIAVLCASLDSLQADLLAAGERAQHLNVRIRQLEKRLSEGIGETV